MAMKIQVRWAVARQKGYWEEELEAFEAPFCRAWVANGLHSMPVIWDSGKSRGENWAGNIEQLKAGTEPCAVKECQKCRDYSMSYLSGVEFLFYTPQREHKDFLAVMRHKSRWRMGDAADFVRRENFRKETGVAFDDFLEPFGSRINQVKEHFGRVPALLFEANGVLPYSKKPCILGYPLSWLEYQMLGLYLAITGLVSFIAFAIMLPTVSLLGIPTGMGLFASRLLLSSLITAGLIGAGLRIVRCFKPKSLATRQASYEEFQLLKSVEWDTQVAAARRARDERLGE